MKVKIFYARTRRDLEKQVNEWLSVNPVSPNSMRFQFTSVGFESVDSYEIDHTLVLFYVPMHAM